MLGRILHGVGVPKTGFHDIEITSYIRSPAAFNMRDTESIQYSEYIFMMKALVHHAMVSTVKMSPSDESKSWNFHLKDLKPHSQLRRYFGSYLRPTGSIPKLVVPPRPCGQGISGGVDVPSLFCLTFQNRLNLP